MISKFIWNVDITRLTFLLDNKYIVVSPTVENGIIWACRVYGEVTMWNLADT